MQIGFSDPGVIVQVVGSDYRNTPGVYVPPTDGHPDKAVPFSELLALERSLTAQIQTLRDQVNLLHGLLQQQGRASSVQEFLVELNGVPVEIPHDLGKDPAIVAIYDRVSQELITDSVLVWISEPNHAITIRSDVPVSCRVLVKAE